MARQVSRHSKMYVLSKNMAKSSAAITEVENLTTCTLDVYEVITTNSTCIGLDAILIFLVALLVFGFNVIFRLLPKKTQRQNRPHEVSHVLH